MTNHPTRPSSRSRPAALAALLCCALFAGAAGAADKNTPAEPPAKDKPQAQPPRQLDKYYLVILRRGAAWTPQETPETQRIQAEHLGHLRHMAEAGKLVVAGPFDEQQDPTARGLCLYKTETLEEARKLAEEDPAVKAGRLKVELMAWYTEKGALTFPLAESYARAAREKPAK
jgi:uncharacterized protein YciI